MNLTTLTADAILETVEPERLFPETLADAQAAYRELVKIWHPDRPCGSVKVFDHVTKLYEAVTVKIDAGTWSHPSQWTFHHDGKVIDFKFKRRHVMDIGEVAYGRRLICYKIDEEYVVQYENALRIINKLNTGYASPEMQTEMSRFLPDIHLNGSMTIKDKKYHVLFLRKTPDVFMLRDLLVCKTTRALIRDPRHVAWIGNSLWNILCYLQYAGITHNDVSLYSCFISPQFHTGLLLGGWWFGREVGKPLGEIPWRSFSECPSSIERTKKASCLMDSTLLCYTLRELLGDGAPGLEQMIDSGVPEPMAKFLTGIRCEKAAEGYHDWRGALEASFGKRHFVELKVDESDIYGKA